VHRCSTSLFFRDRPAWPATHGVFDDCYVLAFRCIEDLVPPVDGNPAFASSCMSQNPWCPVPRRCLAPSCTARRTNEFPPQRARPGHPRRPLVGRPLYGYSRGVERPLVAGREVIGGRPTGRVGLAPTGCEDAHGHEVPVSDIGRPAGQPPAPGERDGAGPRAPRGTPALAAAVSVSPPIPTVARRSISRCTEPPASAVETMARHAACRADTTNPLFPSLSSGTVSAVWKASSQ